MDVDQIVAQALKEDLGTGDVTVRALVPPDLEGAAEIVAKETGVLAGVETAARVFTLNDGATKVERCLEDGAALEKGDTIVKVRGRVAALLESERTALNFLQHLSGVATKTQQYVRAVKGTRAVILDTRKTTPGLRIIEKAAVAAGGGGNHRMGLYDMVLVKDNHLALLSMADEPAAVEKAVRLARDRVPDGIAVEVEVSTREGALAAARAGAQMILLDNMNLDGLARTVEAIHGEFGESRPLLEASGGITRQSVRDVALTGVDRISVGALTHSVKALDIAMYMSIG